MRIFACQEDQSRSYFSLELDPYVFVHNNADDNNRTTYRGSLTQDFDFL
jgi:hypothetical protein